MAGVQSGELASAIFNGVLVSLLFVWLFLARYRRAVERTMRERAPADPAGTAIAPIPTSTPSHSYGTPEHSVADSVRRQVAFVYGASFALSTLAVSWPMMAELARETSGMTVVVQALIVWLTNWAPAVILTGFVVAMRPSLMLKAFLRVWLLGAVLSVVLPMIARLVNGAPFDATLAMNAVWFSAALALNALPPLLMVLITGRPRIRNVMPLALALIVLLSLALSAFDRWMMASVDDLSRVPALLQWAVGTFGVFGGPALIFLVLSLPVGVVAWWYLGRIELRYTARRFSDVQLIVDAWWCLVLALHLISLWHYGAGVALGACALAFVLYFAAVRVMLRLLRVAGRSGGPSLLLLRVFGFQKRTEALFDAVAARWRFEGPVAMIAGADLAVRSIDAGEALAFARGEIAAGYVDGAAKLALRMGELDGPADPDGRYRVTDFFCYDDTWRATLQSLVGRCNVVLMDLRGLTQANTGCVYELQQLAAARRLAHCVFVVDETTDKALAERTLGGDDGRAPAWVHVKSLDGSTMATLWHKLVESSAG